MIVAESIIPPIGAEVRIYCNGLYNLGTVIRTGSKCCTVRYQQKNGEWKEVRTLVYPEGTILSATNWGVGSRTAFWQVPDSTPEPERPTEAAGPRQGTLFD